MVDMKKKAIDILEDYSNSYSQVDLETLTKFLEQIKSEARKEIIERLKEKYKFYGTIGKMELYKDLDNLLKEMEGK